MIAPRFLRWLWLVPIIALVTYVALRPAATEQAGLDEARDARFEAPQVNNAAAPDRFTAPSVDDTRLTILDEGERPPEPAQWGLDAEPVPFGQWWSGLATGPGIPALWAKPLLLRMSDDGRVDLSAPSYTSRPDGSRDAIATPAMFFDFAADASIRVVDHGPLHVRFVVTSADGDVVITMIQGSPFLEIEGSGIVTMTVPGLTGLAPSSSNPSVERFSTATGPWLLAMSTGDGVTVSGDQLTIDLSQGSHAVGPVPADADDRYDAAAMNVATHRLLETFESVEVDVTGAVRQTLGQRRDGGDTAVAWALLPHHESFLALGLDPVGILDSVHGPTPIVVAPSLPLDYPAVPIVWDAVAPVSANGVDFDPVAIDEDHDRPSTAGSYFGAKYTATDAMVHDILQAAGAGEEAAPFLEAATDSLGALVTAGTAPELMWDPGWGSAVVTPAEFGAGVELNDHHLQNGYWVSAAASVVAADPNQQYLLEESIDLLVADYAGASVVPHLSGVVAEQGMWSPSAGHSWASGIGGFGAGNSLESISESSHAWWAAAKWFLVTDRADLAEPFIARLTIESWLTGFEFLPSPEHQAADRNVRPWTGVVWSGKTDQGTWFSASDEAALGIRLIPLGPQSFSRYPDNVAVQAASDRWAWCDALGSGCNGEWSNLLDSDAAVAGRPELVVSPDPEQSTTEAVRLWWRSHWQNMGPASGWQCTPGAAMRSSEDGSLHVLLTNPSPQAMTARCEHATAPTMEFEIAAQSASSQRVDVPA